MCGFRHFATGSKWILNEYKNVQGINAPTITAFCPAQAVLVQRVFGAFGGRQDALFGTEA